MPWHEAAVREMAQSDDLVDSFARLGVKAVPGDRRGVTTVDLRNASKAHAEANSISTEGWNDATHMKVLAARLQELHGAERAKRQGRPFHRNIGLQDL
jgi:hypothetical protein